MRLSQSASNARRTGVNTARRPPIHAAAAPSDEGCRRAPPSILAEAQARHRRWVLTWALRAELDVGVIQGAGPCQQCLLECAQTCWTRG
jgi:hypothetical protein